MKTSRHLLRFSRPAIVAAGSVPLMHGCGGPNLDGIAQAIMVLGVCMVLSSIAWSIGIVLFGRSRKR